jgi:hypothetical protein
MGTSLTAVSSGAVAESCGSTVKKDEEGIVPFQQTTKQKVSFFRRERDRSERAL